MFFARGKAERLKERIWWLEIAFSAPNFAKAKATKCLVDPVGNGVAGVQLDGGEDGLTGGGRRHGLGISQRSVGNSVNGSSVVDGGGKVEAVGVTVIEVGVLAVVVGEGSGCVSQRGGDGSKGGSCNDNVPLGTVLGLLEGGEELELGGGNLRGVSNGQGSDSLVDGCDGKVGVLEGGGDGKVGGAGDPEAKVVGDVVHTLVNVVCVDVLVAAGDTGVGVADLLLGRVDVGVAVVHVAELILSLVLAGCDVGDCRGNGDGGNSDGSGLGQDGGSVGVVQGGAAVVATIESTVGAIGVRRGDEASAGGGHKGRKDDLAKKRK
jgi:hypothetical protein